MKMNEFENLSLELIKALTKFGHLRIDFDGFRIWAFWVFFDGSEEYLWKSAGSTFIVVWLGRHGTEIGSARTNGEGSNFSSGIANVDGESSMLDFGILAGLRAWRRNPVPHRSTWRRYRSGVIEGEGH